VFRDLLDKNPFVFRFYPNFHAADAASVTFRAARSLAWMKRVLETALKPLAPLAELVCRSAYRSYLRRRATTWQSPEQVRLQADCLKLHTRSHRQSVLDRLEAGISDLRFQIEDSD